MDYFKSEITDTIKKIQSVRSEDDLCFVLLSDSHLSEEGAVTCENIRAVDKEIGFDFAAHLGNMINGNNPEKISSQLLKNELQMYKECTKNKKLFVSQGDADGWRDERFLGQLAEHIITDEFWRDGTSFIDEYENVSRQGNNPYYYVDIPDKNVRLVFLCSYHYQIDNEIGYYKKYTQISAKQAAWLKNEALAGCEGKTVFLFSHRMPNSVFETGTDVFVYKGNCTEPLFAIIQQAQKSGVNIGCWFGGGYGYDSEVNVAGINLSVINSQLPKCVNNAKCDNVRFADDRALQTVNQDCWDAVVLKQKERKVYIYRFGWGEDRVLEY